MNNIDQIAAEAAKKVVMEIYDEEDAYAVMEQVAPIIKAAIENAYQLGWNTGWSKRNEVAMTISDQVKEQLPKEKEEQPFSWIDNPPPSPRQ